MFSFPKGGARPAAALTWHAFGLSVIPVAQDSKVTAVKWDPWLANLSADKITQHWAAYPAHDVGAILGDQLIVLDADSPQSIAALEDLERRFSLTPKLIVQTRKGFHHYFARAAVTFARSDAHSTEKHPERVDVKTGRALVVLPPSGGREVVKCEADSVDDLTEATQEFVDAVFEHNGRPPPRPHAGPVARADGPPSSQRMAQVAALLDRINPDAGYADWTGALMAVHHESGGSDEGLEIADRWSSRGAKYRGHAEVAMKWRSFRLDVPHPHSLGTLVHLAKKCGADPTEILDAVGPQFEPCDFEVVETPAETSALPENALARFSLLGYLQQIQRQAVAQVFVLAALAIVGQLTVFFAPPGSGKTLLTLALLLNAIASGAIDPRLVFYLNVDDSLHGLLDKLPLGEEYGFHVLVDGYRGFEVRHFIALVEELIEKDQARGVIIILDTLKRFTDLMDKKSASRFSATMRRFCLKGGTVVALAHTNKNPGRDGRLVYAGTTDIVDDFDAAFILEPLEEPGPAGEKVVVFRNIKRRGNVALEAAYSYRAEPDLPYLEVLLSVREFDEKDLRPLRVADEMRSQAELIDAVASCIRDGVRMKMQLAAEVARRAGISRGKALALIERYTGDDPALHRWRFTVGARGAKVYELLAPDAAADGQPPAD